jgi:hypothetical protein
MIMQSLKDEIGNWLSLAPQQYHRLSIILPPKKQPISKDFGDVLEELGIAYINLGLSLSQLLLELTERQRSLRLFHVIDHILADYEGKPVFLDHIEVLFTPQLNQDPLRLLQGLSRNRVILALWNGQIENGNLTYASSDHPEHRRYSLQDLTILSLSDYLD